MYIEKKEYSFIENRFLAKIPEIFDKKYNINYELGKDIDNYYKDRFFLRNCWTSIYYKTIGKMNDIIWVKDGVYNKNTKKMFIQSTHFRVNLSEYLVEPVVKNFDLLENFCQNNNIKLYILIVPSSTDIGSFEPYKLERVNSVKRDIINKIKLNSKAKVIYPIDEILNESKSYPVYFKTDIHWTDNGTYTGYQLLMKEIKKDFPRVTVLGKQDFGLSKSKLVRSDWDRDYTIGGNFEHSFYFYKNQADKILDTDYLYYDHKQKDLLKKKIVNEYKNKYKEFYYPKGEDLKLMILGTSMSENLTEFIPFTFKHTKYYRLNEITGQKREDDFKIMKLYKDRILEYKPDILIFCIFVGNLYSVNELFNIE